MMNAITGFNGVREYQNDLEEFGALAFETRRTLGTPTTFFLLNEPQATLILTYMRNSEIVRDFKKRLYLSHLKCGKLWEEFGIVTFEMLKLSR